MRTSLSTDILRYHRDGDTKILRSHLLHPHDDISIIVLLGGEKENIISILEDHFLESISSTEWRHGEEETDFEFVTEKYNHILANIDDEDSKNLDVLFAVVYKEHLIVSTIGGMCAILRESDESISIIHESNEKYRYFESSSSGEIPRSAHVFLLSSPIEQTLGEDFYDDAKDLPSDRFQGVLTSILEREKIPSLHMVRISSTVKTENKKKRSAISSQADILRENIGRINEVLPIKKALHKGENWIQGQIQANRKIFLGGFLGIGIILLIGLLSVILSSVFDVKNPIGSESKNALIEAKNLIDESQKLTSNPQAFSDSINQAEAILAELEKKQVYLKDTQDLKGRIEAMKKEMYGIEVIDLSKKASIFPIDSSFVPVGVYELDKKLNLVGQAGAYLDFAIGNNLPSLTSYPTGEVIDDFILSDDNVFFAITREEHLMTTKQNKTFEYINVMGQDGWEKADRLKTYNGNLYLIDKSTGEIWRHRPGVNGYSQKSRIGDKAFPGLIDVGIDGGFYILKKDRIERVIAGSTLTEGGIVLNKLPTGFQIQSDDAKLIVNKNLKYIYILDGKKVWIFSPDSKNFQDVKSWTYVAQMEISTNETVADLAIPRDGLFYITTEHGVYEVTFEVVDNTVIVH